MAHLMWDLVMDVAPELFEDLYGLRGKFKKECPHFEKRGMPESGMPMSWCGDQGDYIEKCLVVCERFHILMFEGD